MVKPKKTIASVYKKEEAQAKNSRHMFNNPTATHHNNESRVYVNKNKKRQVPNLQRCLKDLKKNHSYKVAADNLQNENYCLQKKLSDQEKRNTSLTSLLELKQKELELKQKEITELYQLIGDLQKNLNEPQEVNTEITKSSKCSQKQIKSLTKKKEKVQTPTPRHIEDIVSTDGPPAKKRKIDNSTKGVHIHYSQSFLKTLVMHLGTSHSDTYELWRNVLWALNQYGCERGYDTLEIADCFSKRSSKYKNLQDVTRTFEASDGTLSLQYLIDMIKIWEGKFVVTTNNFNMLPSKYLPVTVNKIDFRDRHKIRINCNSANELLTSFIIPDQYVLTNEDGDYLCFLDKKITSKNPTLATLCPEMANGFNVTFDEMFYEFKARNDSLVTMKLHYPLKPAESFIILPSGKQEKKATHLTEIRKALRAEVAETFFSGLDEDFNIKRTEEELVDELFDENPNIKNRYVSSKGIFYYCKPDTNLWFRLSELKFYKHLCKILKTTLQLSKAELRLFGEEKYICDNIRKQINIDDKIKNSDNFPDLLDSNIHLFITNNKTIDTSSIPLIVRNIEKEDLAQTTCGWSYDYALSKKHMKSVRSYFDKLIPRQCEREWFLSFVAKMLNGQRMNEHFLVLANKRENEDSISTLLSLIATLFGDYHITYTKSVTGLRRGSTIHKLLKKKRLLVADKLTKNDTLYCDFIKATTVQSNYYILDGKKFYPTVQTGLIMVFTEDNVPKFDKNNQDFVERMVTIPMRSRFLCKQEYVKLIKKGEKMTDIHIADDSLKHCPEWNSAVLDLLIDYYNEPLQPIPKSFMDLKKKLCIENHDYYDWLDSHVYKDENNPVFISAWQILEIMKKKEPNCFNPFNHLSNEKIKLKFAMSQWANKNGFSYKARHVFMSKTKTNKLKRVVAKYVIINAGLHNINEE